MLDKELFKIEIKKLQNSMKINPRGVIDQSIEIKVIDELCNTYLKMVDKYENAVATGYDFPAQPNVLTQPESERTYVALLDFLERMELDFMQKLSLDIKHEIDKNIEIGKIKIALLDGVRRNLNFARSQ